MKLEDPTTQLELDPSSLPREDLETPLEPSEFPKLGFDPKTQPLGQPNDLEDLPPHPLNFKSCLLDPATKTLEPPPLGSTKQIKPLKRFENKIS